MTCCKCGTSSAPIHLTQIIGGVSTTNEYCESCAPAEMRQTMLEIKNGTFDPEAQWQAKWERLHAEHPQFSCEAYSFVQKSIHRRYEQSRQDSGNISDLLESCQGYAKELYGGSARAQLKSWGIETFLDVGEIFLLINSGDLKGKLDPTMQAKMETMHEKMRESLRQKYGQSPFLSDSPDRINL